MDTLKPSEVLRGAVEQLHEHGWCRHSYRDLSNRLCALGAIQMAQFGCITIASECSSLYTRASRALYEELEAQFGSLPDTPAPVARSLPPEVIISAFNDSRVSRVEEMIAAMEKAALKCEEQGQ